MGIVEDLKDILRDGEKVEAGAVMHKRLRLIGKELEYNYDPAGCRLKFYDESGLEIGLDEEYTLVAEDAGEGNRFLLDEEYLVLFCRITKLPTSDDAKESTASV